MSTTSQREYRYSPTTTQFSFRANPALTEQIKSLSAERCGSQSNTIRMLLYLGLEAYKLNELEGNVTGQKHREEVALRKAVAEEKSARLKSEKDGLDILPFVPVSDED